MVSRRELTEEYQSIYAVNADGTGTIQIVEPFILTHAYRPGLYAAPVGGRVAFFAEPEELKPELRVLSLHTQSANIIAELIANDVDPGTLDSQAEVEYMQTYAASVGDPTWSMDGESIAFAGAMEADNSDLFLYSFADGTTTRLTDGPTQTVYIQWSPDNEYILHGAAKSLYYGASGNQYELRGIYAARADHTGVHLVYPLNIIAHERFPGWVSDHEFLVDRWHWWEDYSNLRAVDLRTGAMRLLWGDHYNQRAFDPKNGVLLLSISAPGPDGTVCSTEDAGFYLLPVDSGEAQRLSIPSDCKRHDLLWSPQAGVFFADTVEGPVTIDSEGFIAPLRVPSLEDLTVAPDGERWVVSDNGLWLEEHGGIRRIFNGTASLATWSPDGERVFFFGPSGEPDSGETSGLYLAEAPQYIPYLIAAGFTGEPDPRASSVVWVKP